MTNKTNQTNKHNAFLYSLMQQAALLSQLAYNATGEEDADKRKELQHSVDKHADFLALALISYHKDIDNQPLSQATAFLLTWTLAHSLVAKVDEEGAVHDALCTLLPYIDTKELIATAVPEGFRQQAADEYERREKELKAKKAQA